MGENDYRYLLCFILGVCIGGALLWGISMQRGRTEAAMPETIEPMETEKAQMPEPGDTGTAGYLFCAACPPLKPEE